MLSLGDSTFRISPDRRQRAHGKHQSAILSVKPYCHMLSLLEFDGSLLQERAAGGSKAGLMLRDEIAGRIYGKYAAKDWKIVTKLYLDIEGLVQRHTLPRFHTVSGLREFFAEFTRVQSAFDVVDTGHEDHGNAGPNDKIKGRIMESLLLCLSTNR